MNNITDLIEDALGRDDYKIRINFLIAGLICEESNNTTEKQEQNNRLRMITSVQPVLIKKD